MYPHNPAAAALAMTDPDGGLVGVQGQVGRSSLTRAVLVFFSMLVIFGGDL